eukprot:1958733-Amphidinium_carterae.1
MARSLMASSRFCRSTSTSHCCGPAGTGIDPCSLLEPSMSICTLRRDIAVGMEPANPVAPCVPWMLSRINRLSWPTVDGSEPSK